MKTFDFNAVSRSCPICFNRECPSHDDCLRFMAGQVSPDKLTYHLCVTPQAVQGDRCPLFQKREPVRLAYGFSRSYDNVLKRDFTSIRKQLTAYLGNKRGYYKRLRGEWPLRPQHQRYIEQVFKQFGYEGKVVYDRIEEVYVLDVMPY